VIEVLVGSYPPWHNLAKEDDRNFLGPDPDNDNGDDEDPPRLREAVRGSGKQRHPNVANAAHNWTQVHPSGTPACGRCGTVDDDCSSLPRPVLTCTAHSQPRI